MRILRIIRTAQPTTKGTLPMPRQLQYVAGVRLIEDAYDRWQWHFVIARKRFALRARGGAYVLCSDDGMRLGTFDDVSRAVARAREHAQTANTERLLTSPLHPRRPTTT